MSALKVLAAAIAVTGFVTTHAMAMSITNRDGSTRIVFIEKASVPSDVDSQMIDSQFALSKGKSMTELCEQSCSVRLAGSTKAYAAKNTDRLVIKNGTVVNVQK